jgi:hypothetical protein
MKNLLIETSGKIIHKLFQIKKDFNEEIINLFFHILKSFAALYINWLILNKLSKDEYIIWAITSSIFMIATASDLGIGQHTVTLLLNSRINERKKIITNACIAMVPLFLLSYFFVIFSLGGSLLYKNIMAFLVSFRLFSIPFGALLNATNNFKIRKIIDFISYLIAAIFINILVLYYKNVQLALLALNISFILAAIISIVISLKKINQSDSYIDKINFKEIRHVFKGSLPYLINNLTSLLTYGGFIWLCSFILSGMPLAKLAVLHNFLLVTLFQIYDVFLRSRQADLVKQSRIKSYLKINRLIFLFTPIVLLIIGKISLNIIASNLLFSQFEIFLYSIFIIIELSFLLLQSIIQVDLILSKYLIFYSIIKSFFLFLSFLFFYLFKNHSLSLFILTLNLCSIVGLIFTNFHLKSKSGLTL